MKRNNDQKADLRAILDDIQEVEKEQSKTDDMDAQPQDDIDILNLPPRKEVHRQNKLTKFKIKRPLIRFIGVVLILLIMFVLALYVTGLDVLNEKH
ncbi:MAG TPA: hypothetical protein VK136_02685 [Bacillota bacterium]|nr:hypothetical protein [Bacillota bacterium]